MQFFTFIGPVPRHQHLRQLLFIINMAYDDKDLISDFIFDFTAAGVVPCGGRKTSPRTSTIVQFLFYFGPLRSPIIF